ncbi:MAG: DNA polymerase III subunit chi [Alphaproteobacteria bacterium]|nr:DNA polymerase III subunit chi [Alphaproteobacteria bacterium]
MAEVLFYHLTRTPLEKTLPDLLEKSRAKGWKVVVRVGSQQALDQLDDQLWLGAEDGFLAHGKSGGNHDTSQPILLTCSDKVSNGADILIAVAMAQVALTEVPDFKRICIVFDGNDQAALTRAREQWSGVTDAGFPAKYWSQEGRNWFEKASKNT